MNLRTEREKKKTRLCVWGRGGASEKEDIYIYVHPLCVGGCIHVHGPCKLVVLCSLVVSGRRLPHHVVWFFLSFLPFFLSLWARASL
ncbi:hypothetical protein TRSC58_07468 [Trypanosoma rangeli SC58]|uniref:Uncharacterized protein n=1 Tax=Trypanosoma rangeli SC58 TaxID=429131 RepID=A0A061ISS1_TRYRA|nr:hypothetical protein TRSC58_07468 [Trypanosoma rangeli SC58]